MRGRCQEILVMTNLDLPHPAGTHAAVPECEDHPLACRRHAPRARWPRGRAAAADADECWDERRSIGTFIYILSCNLELT